MRSMLLLPLTMRRTAPVTKRHFLLDLASPWLSVVLNASLTILGVYIMFALGMALGSAIVRLRQHDNLGPDDDSTGNYEMSDYEFQRKVSGQFP